MDCGFAACHGVMGGKRVLFRCPHCRTKSQVRTSRDLNVLMRELIYACLNHECGHTFAAYLEVARTLSPSAMPDPSVYLPMSEHVRKKIADHPTMTDAFRNRSHHCGDASRATAWASKSWLSALPIAQIRATLPASREARCLKTSNQQRLRPPPLSGVLSRPNSLE